MDIDPAERVKLAPLWLPLLEIKVRRLKREEKEQTANSNAPRPHPTHTSPVFLKFTLLTLQLICPRSRFNKNKFGHFHFVIFGEVQIAPSLLTPPLPAHH